MWARLRRFVGEVLPESVATFLVVLLAGAVSIGLGYASRFVGAPEPWPLIAAMGMSVAATFGLSKLADVVLDRRYGKAGER